MARHKNADWSVGDKCSTAEAQLTVLMDIRDALLEINTKLGCWRIQKMFVDIDRLDRRLKKRIKL